MVNELVRVDLPRYEKVKNLILQFSSLLRLNREIRFRVCNVCSKKLPAQLSYEHSEHLVSHQKQWNSYMSLLSRHLKEEIKKDDCKSKKEMSPKSEESEESSSSSLDLDNPFFVPNAVDCLQSFSGPDPPPSFTTFERILSRKFTYDKNPIRAFREVTDRKVVEQCNVLKYNQIHDEIGRGLGYFLRPKEFYASDSEGVRMISRMLCQKQCFFLPGECFSQNSHDSHFKELLKKELHDRFQPQFDNNMTPLSTTPVLEYNEDNHPKVYELCEKIGRTTKLEYNSEGYLDLNYDLFCEQLFDCDRPLFLLEENKVFDVILGLLLSASEKFSSLREDISQQYFQTNPGLNKPVLSLMMHGPDLHTYSSVSENCETRRITSDTLFKQIVTHPDCNSFINEDHWMFKHFDNNSDPQEQAGSSVAETDTARQGPASLPDQSIVYPCNLGHWHGCLCQICELVKYLDCHDHKKHMQFNVGTCLIKDATSCPDHVIDHPNNVQPGDIRVHKHILLHNGEVSKDGRRLQTGEVILAGMKSDCEHCTSITEDHFRNHLSFHSQCNICLYEVKSKDDINFWLKVCQVCGKKFDCEKLKIFHQKRHDVPSMICEICQGSFSSKYNFKRHLNEAHNVFLDANNGPIDGTEEDEIYMFTCSYCQKECKYERNVVTHIMTVHFERDTCRCKLCGAKFTRRDNLKRHLGEQHDLINIGLSLDREEIKEFSCSVCGKFGRKNNLIQHEQIHRSDRTKFECDLCDATFLYKTDVDKHKRRRHEDQPDLICSVCERKFKDISYLSEHYKTHSRSRDIFPCEFCDKKYHSRWNLKRHVNH